MLDRIQNKVYVTYAKYIQESFNELNKKSTSKKIYGLAIRWLAYIFLSGSERTCIKKWVMGEKQESHKKIASTFSSVIAKDAIPTVDFLHASEKKERHDVSLKALFYKAVKENDLFAVQQFLPSVTKTSEQSEYLELAVRLGRLEVVSQMQQSQWLNSRKRKETLFILAIECGHVPLVQFFLNNHVRLNCKTKQGSPLAAAFIYKKIEVAQYLIQEGAQFRASKKQVKAIFFHLALNKNRELAELFVKEGLPGSLHPKYKNELFDLACYFGFLEFLQKLVSQSLDLKKLDKKSKESLLIAAVLGKQEAVVKFLIGQGIIIKKRDFDPLVEAAFESFSLVKLLVENQVEIDQPNKWGFSPLLVALTEGNEECAHYLLQRGANLERCQNIRIQKNLSNLFALRGKSTLDSHIFAWEGMNYGFGIQALKESVEKFFSEPLTQPICAWPNVASQKQMLDGLENVRLNRTSSKTEEEIIADYQQGKMVLLTSGWVGHACYRLLYKGFYVEVNRGRLYEDGESSGYKIYKIDAALTSKLVKMMRRGEKRPLEFVQKDRKKIHSRLNLKQIVEGKLKAQKVGNCAIASGKAIFRMMLLVDQFDTLRLNNETEDPQQWLLEAEKASSQLYKSFSTDARERAIHQALIFYQDKKKEEIPFLLLLFVLAKFKGNKETSLALALFLQKQGVDWKLKNEQGKGFVDYVRAHNNLTLIPFLMSKGLFASF